MSFLGVRAGPLMGNQRVRLPDEYGRVVHARHMARCFDHGTTVLVQLTGEEASVRQAAEESLAREERWDAGGKPVKFWFRKDNATHFKSEYAYGRGPGWGPPLVGYNFLLFRARDIAGQRGWLNNPWPDYTIQEIRAVVSEMQQEENACQQEQERLRREEEERLRPYREAAERERLQRTREEWERLQRERERIVFQPALIRAGINKLVETRETKQVRAGKGWRTVDKVHRKVERTFRWKDLRHTFASWLRRKGADLDVIAQLLGHRPGSPMTTRYAHITADLKHEAVRGLSGLIPSLGESTTDRPTDRTPERRNPTPTVH